MPKIGERILKKVSGFVEELLLENQSDIDKTFGDGEEALKVPIGIYFSQAKSKTGVRARVTIKFPTDFAKGSKMIEADEDQMDLDFDGEQEE